MVETLATSSKRMGRGGGWLPHPRHLRGGLPDNRVRAPQRRPLQSPRGQPRLPPATTKDRDLAHCPNLSTFSLCRSRSSSTIQAQARGAPQPWIPGPARLQLHPQPLDPHRHPPGSATGSLIANLDFPAIPRRGIRGNQITELFSPFVQLMG